MLYIGSTVLQGLYIINSYFDLNEFRTSDVLEPTGP